MPDPDTDPLLCPDCGAALVARNPFQEKIQAELRAAGRPRFSRKRRLCKKFEKQWRARNPCVLDLAYFLSLSRGSLCLYCSACSVEFSLTELIGRMICPLQPLPPGAVYSYFEGSEK